MDRKRAPHKKRISAWTNPWLIGIGVALMLIGSPMVLWLMTYHSDIAVKMFVITWLSLTTFVLLMAKKSLDDPRYYVDRKVLDRTKREIETQRDKTRREFLKTEIEMLSRGDKAPVLDIWRLDPVLSKRHPYFSAAEAIVLDPIAREIQFRIQIGEIDKLTRGAGVLEIVVPNDASSYLKIVVSDPYLILLRRFFDLIVLQVDSLREDERHIDISYPIFSLLAEFRTIQSGASQPSFNGSNLMKMSDVRFDGGNEIEPHRAIESASSAGSK